MRPADEVFPITPSSTIEEVVHSIRQVTVAKDQPQYQPLPSVLLYDDRVTCSRWEFDAAERQKLLEGGRIRFYAWTFDAAAQASCLLVDSPDLQREPVPIKWQFERCDSPDGIYCAWWELADVSKRLAATQGYIYLLIWNESEELMPTLLQVEAGVS